MIAASLLSLLTATTLPVPATLEDLNAMAELLNCSGSVVSLGRDDSKRAVILTAGHCARYPYLYKNGEAEAGTLITPGPEKEKFTSLYPGNTTLQSPLKARLNNLYYGTLTKVDVSLFETTLTLGELKSKGIAPMTLADRLPKPGERVKITSALWKQTQECTVDRIIENDAEERALFGKTKDVNYHFRNSILLSSDCSGEVGWSGAPLFDPQTNQVLGLVSRIYKEADRVSPSTFLRFMNGLSSPTSTGRTYVVASNITDLKDCLTADGTLLTEGFTCSLPAPTTKKSSSWPKAKR